MVTSVIKNPKPINFQMFFKILDFISEKLAFPLLAMYDLIKYKEQFTQKNIREEKNVQNI